MQTVTVGQKYQIVIPKKARQKVKSIKPGNKVSVQSTNKNTIIVKPLADDWLERNYGAMKDAWKDIDPIAELEKMRNEW